MNTMLLEVCIFIIVICSIFDETHSQSCYQPITEQFNASIQINGTINANGNLSDTYVLQSNGSFQLNGAVIFTASIQNATLNVVGYYDLPSGVISGVTGTFNGVYFGSIGHFPFHVPFSGTPFLSGNFDNSSCATTLQGYATITASVLGTFNETVNIQGSVAPCPLPPFQPC